MSDARREVVITPAALQQMVKDKPSAAERAAIRYIVTDLGIDPFLGYEIAFLKPVIYRIDAGRFRVHYRFDENRVWIEFIGVY